MFEEVLKSAAAPVVVVALFLWYMERSSKQNSDAVDRAEKQRTENAKQAETERREHQIVLNNLWATTIKEMMGKVTVSNEKVASQLSGLDKNMTEQFERLGNTQDILDKLTNLAGTLNKSGPSS